MDGRRYEFVIVGSGAGGATLARELSRKGREVLVIERGRHEAKVGAFQHCLRFYDADRLGMPRRSAEGVILWRAFMAGGSTVVSCGNATRCLEKELAELGVTLEEEFAEAEREMRVAPIAEALLSEGSERIAWAASELGYAMEPMPKALDPVRCRRCGRCPFGCADAAKWSALEYLEEARGSGADIMYGTRAVEVLVENGNARGVRAVGPEGRLDLRADVVILAAGGLGTPVILQQSRIREAGSGLFVDLLVNTYGVTEGLNQIREPTMTLMNVEFHETKGFMLSPYVNQHRMVRFMEGGAKAAALPANRLLGIMTKTADGPAGHVFPNGKVSKPVTERDWVRLRAGSAIAGEILVKAGAERGSILVSKPQGAHPGGTAAVGRVVDRDLQTEVSGLFVCDGSVLPQAPGLPPILTICALAKRLAQTLAPECRETEVSSLTLDLTGHVQRRTLSSATEGGGC